jgi:hypothetical protein
MPEATDTLSETAASRLTRRAIVAGTAVAAAVAILPAAASAASPDPLVTLVDRFLPLHRAYRETRQALRDAYDEQVRFGHHQYPSYEYGSQRKLAFVSDGNVSEIEAWYAKCVDEAETPAQRKHLRWRCEQQVKEARQMWEEWDRLHRELGLYDLEERRDSALAALGDLDEEIIAAKPTSVEGVAAMIRYAIACETDTYEADDEQPYSVRALRSALAFFGEEGGAA